MPDETPTIPHIDLSEDKAKEGEMLEVNPTVDPEAASVEAKVEENTPEIGEEAIKDDVKVEKEDPVVINHTATNGGYMGTPRRKKIKKILGITALAVVIFIAILALAVGIPGYSVYKKVQVVMADGNSLKDAFSKQNIGDIKTGLTKIEKDLGSLQGSYNALGWLKVVPFVGPYWKDGDAAIKGGIYGVQAGQMGVKTLEPYADIIGFGGDKAKSGEETANDRMEFVVKTISQIAPQVEEIGKKATQAKNEIDKIDANRYPETFKGKKIRENIKKVQELVDEGTSFLSQSKPLLDAAPSLLGIDSPKTYLVLFQNDKELRPTGGFITAYSIMTVSKGKFEPVSSNDIYNLDKSYVPNVAAPSPIVKYIAGPYTINRNLRLRDMNWDPDYKTAMELFSKEAKKAGVTGIDGIIAVDTSVVVNILNVIGPVGVPGFGNFSTEIVPQCNCPQVIFELESFADVEGSIVWDQNDPTKIIYAPPNFDNRKKIVGPLMNSVLRNALGQPKEKIASLFQAGWDSVTQKHVLLYMFDEKTQEGAEAFNIAGRMKDYDGDYLHINDANLGGRKANLYATQEVVQDVKVAGDGSVEKTVTITYKNPQGYDGWLNSVLPTWTRVYVPKGSTLISSDGFDDKGETYEEHGKTVFSGGFKLRPQGVVKITLKYKLPFKVKGEYKLLVQKQAGTGSPLFSVNIGRQKDEGYLLTDKEYRFKI
ncbi:MAG TPA: DUF4012 domain-containing protein [Patescibacteria group bacterium]